MGDIVFTARLNAADWDSEKQAWRCPALDIPGATIREVFVSGERADKPWYEVLSGPAMVRWVLPNPPPQIAVVISLSEALSLSSETGWWKRFAVIVPILASLGAATITGLVTYSTAAKTTSTQTSHMLHLRVDPIDLGQTRELPIPIVTINNTRQKYPFSFPIQSETMVIVDVSDAINFVQAVRKQDTSQRQALSNIAMMAEAAEGSVAKLKQLNQLALDAGCPGGAHGIEIPHGRDIAALSTQVIDSLNGLKQNAKLVLQQNPPEPKDFNPHSPDEAGILSALTTSMV